MLKNSGASVPYSPFESASAVSKAHAMCQWYRCPSVFITITVDDAHNCLSLRMCFPIANHANSQFPCPETDASEFLRALAQGDEVFRDNIPIRNGDLMKMINENSVAAVLFFKLLIESVYEHLLGLLPDRLWRKTENYWKFPLGMFGRPTAAMHAIEPQGRKTLHGHLAFFGGMSASILQCSADFDALKTLVSWILDITFTASLPTKSYAAVVTKHLTAPQHRTLPQPIRMNYEAPIVPSKSNPKSILKYLERVYACLLYTSPSPRD